MAVSRVASKALDGHGDGQRVGAARAVRNARAPASAKQGCPAARIAARGRKADSVAKDAEARPAIAGVGLIVGRGIEQAAFASRIRRVLSGRRFDRRVLTAVARSPVRDGGFDRRRVEGRIDDDTAGVCLSIGSGICRGAIKRPRGCIGDTPVERASVVHGASAVVRHVARRSLCDDPHRPKGTPTKGSPAHHRASLRWPFATRTRQGQRLMGVALAQKVFDRYLT